MAVNRVNISHFLDIVGLPVTLDFDETLVVGRVVNRYTQHVRGGQEIWVDIEVAPARQALVKNVVIAGLLGELTYSLEFGTFLPTKITELSFVQEKPWRALPSKARWLRGDMANRANS